METVGIEGAGFNELEEPGFVLGPPCLERYRGEVFRSDDARRSAFDIRFARLGQCLFYQRTCSRLDGE